MALTERLAILVETIGAKKVAGDFDTVGSAADRLNTSTHGAGSGLGALGSAALSAGTLLKGAAVTGLAVGAKQLVDFGFAAVDAASNLGEVATRSATVFGASAATIDAWARGAAEDFGMSQRAALEAAGSFGNLFMQLGESSSSAAEMSQAVTELAADFASAVGPGVSMEQVLQAQQAAFRGEYDSLQRFLPLINAATVEQRALALTGKNTTKELTAQDKALATVKLMFEGAGAALGDFDRTSGSLANQQRTLQANWENMQAELGQKLLPVMTDVVSWLNKDGIPTFLKFAEVVGEGISDAIAFAVGAFADFMSVTGRALEKVDQFIPGMEGIPEGMRDMAAEMRVTEANLHDFHIELDGVADTTVDTGKAFDGASGQVANFGEAAGAAAKDVEDAHDAMVKIKDAQFSLRDAQVGSEDAVRNLADAQDEYNRLLATGGIDLDAITAAQEKYTKAQQDTVDAQADVVKWQEKVAEALKPADAKTVAKANRDLADAEDDVTLAGIALREAQEDLNNINVGGRATADEYREAQIRIRDAERALADATDALAEEERAHGQVMIQGTTITDTYKQATEGLKAAEEAARVAKDAETVAQVNLTSSQAVGATFARDLEDAERKVEAAQRGVEKSAWDAQKAQWAYNESIADPQRAKVDEMAGSVWGLNDAIAEQKRLIEETRLAGIEFFENRPVGGGGLGGIMNRVGGAGASQGQGLGGILQQVKQMSVVQLVLDGKVITEVVHDGLLAKQRTSGSLGFRAN